MSHTDGTLKTPVLSFPCTGLFWRNKAVISKSRTLCNEESAKPRLSQFLLSCQMHCWLSALTPVRLWCSESGMCIHMRLRSRSGLAGVWVKVYLMSSLLRVNCYKSPWRSPSLRSSLTPCILYVRQDYFLQILSCPKSFTILSLPAFLTTAALTADSSFLKIKGITQASTMFLLPGEHSLPPAPAVWAKALLDVCQCQIEINLENSQSSVFWHTKTTQLQC